MAVIQNLDGSFTVDDPTGLRPPTTLPPGSEALFPELAAGTASRSVGRLPDVVPPNNEIVRELPVGDAQASGPLPSPPEPIPEPLPTPPGHEIFREVPPEWLRGTPMAVPPTSTPSIAPTPDPRSALLMTPGFDRPASLVGDPTAMAAGGPNAPNLLTGTSPLITGPLPPTEPGKIDFVSELEKRGETVKSRAKEGGDYVGKRFERGQDVFTPGVLPENLAPGPTAGGAAPEAAPGAAPSRVGKALYDWALQETPATRGSVIPEGNVLQKYKVTKGLPPLPEKTQKEVEEAYRTRAIVAVTEAEKLQGAKVLEAMQHQKAAEDARLRLAELGKMRAQQEAQVRDRMSYLDRRIANVRALGKEDPVEKYWTRKGSAGALMSKIGIALGEMGSAVTGQPNRAYQMVRDEIDDEFKHQAMKMDVETKAIGDERGLLAELRASFMSPDAADFAARSLLAESAAAQTKAMSSMTQGYEARKAGMDLMAQLTFDAAMWRAKSKEAEADRTTEEWKHRVRQVLGGSPARKPSMGEAFMRLRAVGFTPEQTWGVLETQGLSGTGNMSRAEQSEIASARERQVQLPQAAAEVMGLQPGAVLWTSQGGDTSRKIGESLRGNSLHLDNLKEIRKIVNSGPWETLPTADKRRLSVLVAENRYYLKGGLIKEALTQGELENYAPLTGEEMMKFFSIAYNNEAALDTIERGVVKRVESDVGSLYSDPSAKPATGYGLKRGKLPAGAERKR